VELKELLESLPDRRVRYVRTENLGVSAARNLGIASGNAPYIALLDSDDIWHPHKLARQMELLRGDTETDVLHADTDVLHGGILARCDPARSRLNDLERLSVGEMWRRLLRQNFICVNTVVIRRSAGDRVGFFDPKFRALEDKELWIRLLMAGCKLRYMPEVLAIYRVHDSNMSKNVDRMLKGRLNLIRNIDQQVEQFPSWHAEGWSASRKKMLAHAYEEVVETYLEAGEHAQAIRYASPRYVGFSPRAVRLLMASVAGILRRRRSF
jgi:glycosyltransferase involved in cell wall biosynthesis